jgi:hypothetical protein
MTDVLIGDSAYPPASYPTAFNGKPLSGWMVYIGGNAVHVRTETEIAALKAQPWCRYIVPCFVRSNPQSADAAADADAAIAWARAHGQPSGTVVCWDGETAVNSTYFTAVDQRLQAQAGLHELLYGSKATVVGNARTSGGYDEASWTGSDYAPADAADQFASFAAYDLGDFADVTMLWDLHPAAPTGTATPPASPEDDMAQAVDGFATFSWSEDARHIVQVAADLNSGANQPILRVVLLVEPGGPVVLAGDGSASEPPPWKPDYTPAGKVFRFPAEYIDHAYGLELQPVGKPARYAACVV